MTEIVHRTVTTNGITMHVAEAGRGPAVVLLHGAFDLWYTWRHQLGRLAEAGFRALAPDLRGYGETDAPLAVESYSMRNMTADVVGLLDAVSVSHAVIVGHDWGARIAWRSAQLHPIRFTAVAALSVPYFTRSPVAPLEALAQWSKDTFNFALYYQEPGVAEAELEDDVRRSLRQFFYSLSGDAPPGLFHYLFQGKPAGAGVLDGMVDPETMPGWLSRGDLDYYVATFERTGFRGGLNRYRNLDRDWRELADLEDVVHQPAIFLGGEFDGAVVFGSLEPMKQAVPSLGRVRLYPRCGHWVQQERAEEVTDELITFLRAQAH